MGRLSEEQRDTQEQARGEGVPPRIQGSWLHELLSDTAVGRTCEAGQIVGGNISIGIALHGLEKMNTRTVQRSW